MNSRTAFRLVPHLVFLSAFLLLTHGAAAAIPRAGKPDTKVITLTNGTATCTIGIRDSVLVGDTLEVRDLSGVGGARSGQGRTAVLRSTSCGPTGRPRGKKTTPRTPLSWGRGFSFPVERIADARERGGGSVPYLPRSRSSLKLVMTYRLDPEAFYVRRRLVLSDSASQGHFLQFVSGGLQSSRRMPESSTRADSDSR